MHSSQELIHSSPVFLGSGLKIKRPGLEAGTITEIGSAGQEGGVA